MLIILLWRYGQLTGKPVFLKSQLLYNRWVSWVFFFLRVQSSSLPHLGILMGSKILISSKRWQNPRTECQEPKWRPPWEGGPSPPHSGAEQLTGRQGCGGQGCQHFQEFKTLNKQKINIQRFYKLQHYETVGHITQKKNLQYLQSLILRSLEKQWFFLHSFMPYKILQRKVKETQLHTDIWLSWWIKHDFLI